jgi:HlyD family secretion protein
MSVDRRYRLRLALTALALAASAGGFAWLRMGRVTTVQLAEAAHGTVAVRVLGPGTVQARSMVTLGARITATVHAVHADVGDAVERGDRLALLDSRDLAARRGVVDGQQAVLMRNTTAAQAALAKAQADLDLARSRHRRDDELLSAGFVSRAVLEASEAALRAAAASRDNAHAALAARVAEVQVLAEERRYTDALLSFARITSPIDGIIIQRLAEPGATVVPGTPILRIVDPSTLWVATRVDEFVVGRVRAGQVAIIRLRTGERLPGRVERVARQSDAATRELEVDVAFETPPVRFAIDQEAEVSIEAGDDAGIVVPVSALMQNADGRTGVLVVAGERTHFRAVQAGHRDARVVLIREGLAAGESVVVAAEGVKADARVRAIDAAPH